MRLVRFYLSFSILLTAVYVVAQCRTDVLMQVPSTGDGDLAPAIGATVRVCQPGASGYPCNPLATIYTDQTLVTVNPINPLTTDSFGNFTICVSTSTVYLESTYKGTVKVQPTYDIGGNTNTVVNNLTVNGLLQAKNFMLTTAAGTGYRCLQVDSAGNVIPTNQACATTAGTAITSINADTTPAQILAVGTGLTMSDSGSGTHTISLTGGVSSVRLSDLLAANKGNTIQNTNNVQTWQWLFTGPQTGLALFGQCDSSSSGCNGTLFSLNATDSYINPFTVNSTSATLFKVANSGTLSSSSLSGTGSRCLHADANGNISAFTSDCGGVPGGVNNSIQYNNSSSFGGITPGASGTILTSNGVGSTPSFQAAPAGGVTSVGLSAPTNVFSITGSPVTTSGTINLGFQQQNSSYFLAGPQTGTTAIPFIVQTKQCFISTSGTITCSFNSPTQAGSTVIAYEYGYGVAPSDNLSQTYTVVPGANMWYHANSTAGVTTLTMSVTAQDVLMLVEIQGLTATPYDIASTDSWLSKPAITWDAITTTNARDIILGFFSCNTNVTAFTATSPYLLSTYGPYDSGSGYTAGLIYNNVIVTGTFTPVGSGNCSGWQHITSVAFKAGPTSSSATPIFRPIVATDLPTTGNALKIVSSAGLSGAAGTPLCEDGNGNATDSSCSTGGGANPPLNTVTAATASASISNLNFPITWLWQLTGSSVENGFTFSESTASTNATAGNALLGVSTLSGSTIWPFRAVANGVQRGFGVQSSGIPRIFSNGTIAELIMDPTTVANPLGSLSTSTAGLTALTAGSYASGSNWAASQTSSAILQMLGTSGFGFYNNSSGLTVGSNFTPSQIAALEVPQATSVQLRLMPGGSNHGSIYTTNTGGTVMSGGAYLNSSGSYVATDTTSSILSANGGNYYFNGNTGLTPASTFTPINIEAILVAIGGSTYNVHQFYTSASSTPMSDIHWSNAGDIALASGMNFNGSAWTARATTSSMVGLSGSAVQFFGSSGLTVGSAMSPIQVASIQPSANKSYTHFYFSPNSGIMGDILEGSDANMNIATGAYMNAANTWLATNAVADIIGIGPAYGTNGGFAIYGNGGLTVGATFAPTIQASIDGSGHIALNGGVLPRTGMQHIRTPGCTTAATALSYCLNTLTWATPFPDTNYTVVCMGSANTAGIPIVGGGSTKTTTAVAVYTVALTAVASSFTDIDCIAMHD